MTIGKLIIHIIVRRIHSLRITVIDKVYNAAHLNLEFSLALFLFCTAYEAKHACQIHLTGMEYLGGFGKMSRIV